MSSASKHWGIRFARRTHDPSLPPGQPYCLRLDPALPPFSTIPSPLQMTGYVDAAHANDLRNRRSNTGYGLLLHIDPRHSLVPLPGLLRLTSIAAVATSKTARYLRAVMHELGFHQPFPTPQCVKSAIQIINVRRPTDRSRHIDIQAFDIQDWKDNGDILLYHIPGVLNPSDSLTKPTGWILHSHYFRRLMGHFGNGFSILGCSALFDTHGISHFFHVKFRLFRRFSAGDLPSHGSHQGRVSGKLRHKAGSAAMLTLDLLIVLVSLLLLSQDDDDEIALWRSLTSTELHSLDWGDITNNNNN
jgi:hypothetical protein